MVVLLIVLTFAMMVVIDHLFLRQPVLIAGTEPETEPDRPAMVAGFELPQNLSYHPGHTWAVAETEERVRIGADEFAMKFAGQPTAIEVPERGQWIRQGQRIIAMRHDGEALELVSPMEGMVVQVNEKVLQEPGLAQRDPYGEGWLLMVNAPDAKTNFRNLLQGSVAKRWMAESAAALRAAFTSQALATAQDGGVATNDLGTQLPPEQRTRLEAELFLT
jgi:glycine cleavage system H lipoate-binding protein